MDWKQSLDRYLTTQPDDGYEEYYENVYRILDEFEPMPRSDFWLWFINHDIDSDETFIEECFNEAMNEIEAISHIFQKFEEHVRINNIC